MPQRADGDAGFQPARAAQQMAGHGFGRADSQFLRMLAEGALDRDSFGLVAQRSGSAVGIDVIDLFGIDPGVLQRVAHYAESAFAVFGRGREMEGIAAHPVADDLGQNVSAAPFRGFQLLKDQDA